MTDDKKTILRNKKDPDNPANESKKFKKLSLCQPIKPLAKIIIEKIIFQKILSEIIFFTSFLKLLFLFYYKPLKLNLSTLR